MVVTSNLPCMLMPGFWCFRQSRVGWAYWKSWCVHTILILRPFVAYWKWLDFLGFVSSRPNCCQGHLSTFKLPFCPFLTNRTTFWDFVVNIRFLRIWYIQVLSSPLVSDFTAGAVFWGLEYVTLSARPLLRENWHRGPFLWPFLSFCFCFHSFPVIFEKGPQIVFSSTQICHLFWNWTNRLLFLSSPSLGKFSSSFLYSKVLIYQHLLKYP